MPPMIRYRDNFLVLLLKHMSHLQPESIVQGVSDALSEVLGMNLTVEGVSTALPFLEANLFVSSSGTAEMSVKPPTFATHPGDSHPPSHRRMLDAFSPNTQSMLSSFVPNQVLKAFHYAFGLETV